MILAVATRDPWVAARAASALWNVIDDAARAMLASSAAQRPGGVADLIARGGPDGWRMTSDATRRALIDAAASDPNGAAWAGGKIWPALDDAERAMLASSAAAAALMERIGAEGWSIASDATRRALIDAVANAPKSAASASGAVWKALNDEQRALIARGADAADLLASIGADRAESLAPDARRAALKAAIYTPKQARRIAETIWQRMGAAERAGAMRDIANAPDAAARLGVALWDALDDEQRSTIARSAAQPPPRPSPRRGEGVGNAAARLTAGVGARLDDDQIAALVRAAFGGAVVTRLAAQALADGLPWRFWMALFLPEATDDADAHATWRAVIHRTPSHVAALLLSQHRR